MSFVVTTCGERPSGGDGAGVFSARLPELRLRLLRPIHHARVAATNKSTSLAMTHRNRERKRRALAHLTLDPNAAAVQFDELPRQRQAEPRALNLL